MIPSVTNRVREMSFSVVKAVKNAIFIIFLLLFYFSFYFLGFMLEGEFKTRPERHFRCLGER